MTNAMVLDRAGPVTTAPLRMHAYADLEPGPRQLVIEVSACGICRTDLQLVEGDLAMHRSPVVPGHQVVGKVLAAGTSCRHRPGQRIGATWLGGVCGICEFCRSGRENLCPTATFHGWDLGGGYAEQMLVHDDFAFQMPDGPSDAEIAPLLCAGVIGHRALKLSGVTHGHRLGLYGFGSSASLVLQLALAKGINVHVASRNELELSRAEALGANSVGAYEDPPPEALHAAITFAPVGSVVVAALGALRRGGTVVVNAIHLDEVPSFGYEKLWHERSILSVANVTRTDVRELLELATSIPLQVEYREYQLSEANLALRDLASGAIGACGVLIPDRSK